VDKFTKTKYLDHGRSGEIVTAIRSTIKKLVKTDNFIRQYMTRNWKHLVNTSNYDDFYMQKHAHSSKKLIARSDFECRTKQQYSIQKCP
jgi:hypothetical protein